MRYQCMNGHINQGVPKCISFGGVRIDQAVSDEILKVVQPVAIDAALRAAEQRSQQQNERTRALELELEQARYEARLAVAVMSPSILTTVWWPRNWKPAGTPACTASKIWRVSSTR